MSHTAVSKQISKVGKLSKIGQYDISSYLKDKKISINSEYNTNPYKLYYSVNTLYDCIKLLQFSFTLEQYNLFITPASYTHIPKIKLIFYDNIGEDYNLSLKTTGSSNSPTEDTTSYLVTTNNPFNYNIIVGDSRLGVIDSLNKIVDLLNSTNAQSSILSLGIFLGSVNPKRYLNRSFKLHRLKDLYTTFIHTINSYKDSTRLLIELTKNILNYTVSPVNINYNYNQSIYQTFQVNNKTVLNTIQTSGYLALYEHLLRKLNSDLLLIKDTSRIFSKLIKLKQNNLNPNNLLYDLYKNNYIGNHLVYTTPTSLLLTKKGLSPAEKLVKNNGCIWSENNWTYAKFEELKLDYSVYVICFTDGTSIEVPEIAKFKLINGQIKEVRELTKNDILCTTNLNSLNLSYDYTLSTGIIEEIVFDRTESKLIKISLPSKKSNYLTFGNGIIIYFSESEHDTLSPLQIETRLSDLYAESPTLVKDSIVLESKIDLTQLDLINIPEQLKVFNLATVISGSSLNLPEHNLCHRLIDNLKFNPVINVIISNIQVFTQKLTNLAENTSSIKFYDPDKLLYNLLPDQSIWTDHLTIICAKSHFLLILQSLCTLWKNEVYQTISTYCSKHNLGIPTRFTSIQSETQEYLYNAIEQLELILLFDKYYSTHNSLFTINYYEHELPVVSAKLTELIKRKQALPYLFFNQINK